jgi:DNA-binding response OmpR family regulator
MTLESATILLVEDDPLLRHAFRLLLEDAGYTVREAGNAAEAVRVIERELPDLMLLDLGLPDRPGLDVVRELRAQERTCDLPIVALTGRSGDAERKACLAAGCTHYFAKPVEPRELLNRIPDMLR